MTFTPQLLVLQLSKEDSRHDRLATHTTCLPSSASYVATFASVEHLGETCETRKDCMEDDGPAHQCCDKNNGGKCRKPRFRSSDEIKCVCKHANTC